MTVAAVVDVGTHSVLLTVGERAPDGTIRILEDRSEITRLGEGVDRERLLRPAALERAAAAVAAFAAQARHLGASAIRAVGTSAARDARNADELRRLLRREAGVDLEVLSGRAEAEFSYRAARDDPGLGLPPGDLVVVDVGGGSVEVVAGNCGGIRLCVSLDCGAVRVTERFFADDPPTPQQMQDASRWVDACLAALPDPPPGAPLVGIGGTFVNLAAVRLALPVFQPERIHGGALAASEVERQIALFASMPVGRRRQIPGLEPERAEVILAGALVVRRVLARLGAPEIRVSVRGLRYGVLFEMLGEAQARESP